MSYGASVTGEVRNLFREAQRMARGIIPRVGDDETKVAAPVVLRDREPENKGARRRIVAPRATA